MSAQLQVDTKRQRKKRLTVAKYRDLEKIKALRSQGLQSLYQDSIGAEGVEALFHATFDLKSFEQCLERQSIFLVKEPHKKICGYFQMKYQTIVGGNGICQLLSFFVDPEVIAEEYFAEELSMIEHTVQEAGCYRIKGVASCLEFDLMSPYGYEMSAPRYRHCFADYVVEFVPFVKSLYHPKL